MESEHLNPQSDGSNVSCNFQEGEVMARKLIHDIDSENDAVLDQMIATHTPLTLENYIAFAYLGDPPEAIEEDGEFLASIPDVILKNSRRLGR
jgi:hypothetical protein